MIFHLSIGNFQRIDKLDEFVIVDEDGDENESKLTSIFRTQMLATNV